MDYNLTPQTNDFGTPIAQADNTMQQRQAMGTVPLPAPVAPVTNYNLPAPSAPAGMFDDVPFHSWLAKNSQDKYGKPAYDLNDDEIKKGFQDYAGDKGPLQTVIAHHHATNRGEGSDKAMEARINDDTAYYKMMGQNEVEKNLDALKQHFQSLKPAPAAGAAPAPAAPTLADSILPQGTGTPLQPGETALGRAIKQSSAALGLGALRSLQSGSAVNAANPLLNVASTLFPGLTKAPDNSPEINKAKDALASTVTTNEAPANASVGSRITSIVGSLPAGVADMALGGITGSENEIAAKEKELGKPLDPVEKGIIYSKNAVISRLPVAVKGALLTRLASGGIIGSAVQAGRNAIEGNPLTQNLIPAGALGAATGGALGHAKDQPAAPAAPGASKAVPTENLTTPNDVGIGNESGANGQPTPAVPPNEGGAVRPPDTAGAANAGIPADEFTGAYQTRLGKALKDSIDDLELVPGKGTTPQERFNSPEVQKAVDGVLGHVSKSGQLSPEQQLAARNTVATAWANIHDVNPNEVVKSAPEPTANSPEAVENLLKNADESNTPAPMAKQGDVAGLLKEPVTVQGRSLDGTATKEKIPVQFANDTDKLLYKNAMKIGGDPTIEAELVKRGVPSENIEALGQKITADVTKLNGPLKKAIHVSDRGVVPEVTPAPVNRLRKVAQPPKA